MTRKFIEASRPECLPISQELHTGDPWLVPLDGEIHLCSVQTRDDRVIDGYYVATSVTVTRGQRATYGLPVSTRPLTPRRDPTPANFGLCLDGVLALEVSPAQRGLVLIFEPL